MNYIYVFNNYLQSAQYVPGSLLGKSRSFSLPSWSFIVRGEDNLEPAIPCVMEVEGKFEIPHELVWEDLTWSACQRRSLGRSSDLDWGVQRLSPFQWKKPVESLQAWKEHDVSEERTSLLLWLWEFYSFKNYFLPVSCSCFHLHCPVETKLLSLDYYRSLFFSSLCVSFPVRSVLVLRSQNTDHIIILLENLFPPKSWYAIQTFFFLKDHFSPNKLSTSATRAFWQVPWTCVHFPPLCVSLALPVWNGGGGEGFLWVEACPSSAKQSYSSILCVIVTLLISARWLSAMVGLPS